MTTTRKITSEFLPTTPARTHLTADELQGHLALILQEGKRAVELASQSGGSLVVGESDPTPSWLESINLLRQVFGPSEKVSEVASNAVWHDQELVRVTADLLVAVVDSLEYFVAVSDFIRIAARNDDNEKYYGEQGMCQTLLRWMALYREDRIRTAAIWSCVRNLSVYRPNKELFGNGRVLDLALQGILTHSNDISVLIEIVGSVRNLLTADELEQIAVQSELLPALVRLAERWSSNADFMPQLLLCLSHCSTAAEHFPKVSQLGGAEIAITAMRMHKTSQVATSACSVLRKLAMSDDIELRIGRLGGLEALLKLMQQHKQNLDVQAGAATALFNLSFAVEHRTFLYENLEQLLTCAELGSSSATAAEAYGKILLNIMRSYSILEKPRVLQYILSTLHNYVDSSWDGALRIFLRILTETSFIIPLDVLYEVNLAKVAKRAFVNDAFCRFYLSFVATESRFRTQAISHEVHDCIVENLTPEMEEAPLLLATMLSQDESVLHNCITPDRQYDKQLLRQMLWQQDIVLQLTPWSMENHGRRPLAFRQLITTLMLHHTREPASLLYHIPFEIIMLLFDALAAVYRSSSSSQF